MQCFVMNMLMCSLNLVNLFHDHLTMPSSWPMRQLRLPGNGSSISVGGYTACGIPLVRSANGNGNGIPLNGIPFPFVSVKKIFESSVSVRFR